MSGFETVSRHEVHLRGVRVRDLPAMAARHRIRAAGWVDETIRVTAALGS
ncbi:hypothetical protein JOF53_007348 [Crossiella equi]|uniref:Uncharacterized protein n=1 Tax=Crossiella equi TaxID=130796 RepID=A0ABS5APW9_9PSEU|nr:hypothetical protein [Crossiella equi]MBP2478476.1 hypothetical protein [Crossiella equi]